MPATTEQIATVRQEMMDLLRQQLEVLDSPMGLTDAMLMECYQRQERVQELREHLEALAGSEPVSSRGSLGADETSSYARLPVVFTEAVASI